MFISSDPEDQYWNSYSYCDGDPVNLVCPDGRVAFVAPVAWLLKKVFAEKFLEFIFPTFVKSFAAPAFIGAITGLYVYETFLRSTWAPWTIEPQSETPWVKNYVNQQTDNIRHNEFSATKQVQDDLAKSMHLNEDAQAQESGQEGAQEGGKTALPDEAWDKKAPKQVEPGTKEITQQKYNPETKKLETSKVKYDKYGRQIERTDYTDHGTPKIHKKPHTEKIKWDGEFPHGKKIK
jgi:hypothetical protein